GVPPDRGRGRDTRPLPRERGACPLALRERGLPLRNGSRGVAGGAAPLAPGEAGGVALRRVTRASGAGRAAGTGRPRTPGSPRTARAGRAGRSGRPGRAWRLGCTGRGGRRCGRTGDGERSRRRGRARPAPPTGHGARPHAGRRFSTRECREGPQGRATCFPAPAALRGGLPARRSPGRRTAGLLGAPPEPGKADRAEIDLGPHTCVVLSVRGGT